MKDSRLKWDCLKCTRLHDARFDCLQETEEMKRFAAWWQPHTILVSDSPDTKPKEIEIHIPYLRKDWGASATILSFCQQDAERRSNGAICLPFDVKRYDPALAFE